MFAPEKYFSERLGPASRLAHHLNFRDATQALVIPARVPNDSEGPRPEIRPARVSSTEILAQSPEDGVDLRLSGANFCVMRRTAPILFAVFLAMAVRPLQLPTLSCILANAPSQEGCKPNCCANKTCCVISRKTTGPVSQPLYQGGDVKQQPVIGFVFVPVIDSIALAASARPACLSVPLRAHSPPPLAATCIRLI